MVACYALIPALLLAAPQVAPQTRAAATPTVLIADDLAPPSGLFAYPSGNSVELHWRDESSSETGFVVRRKAVGTAHFQDLATVAAGVTTFTDVNAPNGAWLYRVAARGLVAGKVVESPNSNACRVSLPNLPPVITTDLAAQPEWKLGGLLRFTVTVSDPEGDAVALTLLNPSPGMQFTPVAGVASPATMEVRWTRAVHEEIRQRLLFVANSGGRLAKDVTLPERPVRQGQPDCALLVGDVTGDGALDAVVSAEQASILAGGADTGALYVFAGASTPQGDPTAKLVVAGDSLRPRNPYARYYVQLVDVTGDGALDIVCASVSQRVYVWAGGASLSGTPAPTASLSPPGTSSSVGDDPIVPLLQLADLDQDGIQDVVTFDRYADVNGVTDAGAVFVWLGSATLAGTLAPSRVLSVPGAVSGDWLGRGRSYDEEGGVVLADASGDGVLDFLVGAPRADVGGVVDAGAVYLWSGADVLSGASAPSAVLTSPGFADSIGDPLLGDLTGDGVLDVIAGGGGTQAGLGHFHVWSGANLAGTVVPTCTFSDTSLANGWVHLVDVTGDGVLDFLALVPNANAIFLWAGGNLSGTPAHTAKLRPTSPGYLGSVGGVGLDHNLWFEDMNADGVLDLITGDLNAYGTAGALYVWNGGALSGTLAPTAILRANDAEYLSAPGFWIEDLDGDGAPDVLSGSYDGSFAHTRGYVWSGAQGYQGTLLPTLVLDNPSAGGSNRFALADVDGDAQVDVLFSGVDDTRMFLWRGGPGLFGASAPTAVLRSSAEAGPSGLDFVDWNGDGLRDVCATDYTDSQSAIQQGTIQVWFGREVWGGEKDPSLVLSAPGALAHDFLGGRGLRFADVTGDGRLDCLANSPNVDGSASATDTGAIELWSGSSAATVPLTVFADPDARSGDHLGECNWTDL